MVDDTLNGLFHGKDVTWRYFGSMDDAVWYEFIGSLPPKRRWRGVPEDLHNPKKLAIMHFRTLESLRKDAQHDVATASAVPMTTASAVADADPIPHGKVRCLGQPREARVRMSPDQQGDAGSSIDDCSPGTATTATALSMVISTSAVESACSTDDPMSCDTSEDSVNVVRERMEKAEVEAKLAIASYKTRIRVL